MGFDGINSLLLPVILANHIEETHQATVLGIITFIGLVLSMLIQPIAGVVSDHLKPHWGRRGIIGLGVAAILTALVLFGLSQSLIAVFGSYLLLQLAISTAQAGQQGFIPDLVPPRWRGTASGLKGFMDVGGALLAFALLGSLLGRQQTKPALVTVALVVTTTFLLTILLVREQRERVQTNISNFSWNKIFHINFREQRHFLMLVLSRFLFLLGTYAVGRFLLYFVADRSGLEPDAAVERTGMLLFSLTLLTVVASPVAGWACDRTGRKPLMLIGAVLSAVGVVLLIRANSINSIFLFGGLMALGSAAFSTANWTLTTDIVPSAEAARYLALANFGTAGAAAAAGLFGPLIDRANVIVPGSGYTVLFLCSAAAFTLSAVTVYGLSRTPYFIPEAAGG